jgi:hypothetical protein
VIQTDRLSFPEEDGEWALVQPHGAAGGDTIIANMPVAAGTRLGLYGIIF